MEQHPHLCLCVWRHLSRCVIKPVFSAGQSHQSFSNGQSCNVLYANCLLLNMLHQSELIMTSDQHSVLFQQTRERREARCKTKRDTLHEHSRSLIQMTMKMSIVLKQHIYTVQLVEPREFLCDDQSTVILTEVLLHCSVFPLG